MAGTGNKMHYALRARGETRTDDPLPRPLTVNVKVGTESCAGFQVIPTESLGMEYYVMTQGFEFDEESQVIIKYPLKRTSISCSVLCLLKCLA